MAVANDTRPDDRPDVSDSALRIARAVDRLPPGTYNLVITKYDSDILSWNATISRIESLQILKFDRDRCLQS